MRIKRKNEERIGGLIQSRRIDARFGSELTEILPEGVRLKDASGERLMPNECLRLRLRRGRAALTLLRQAGVRFGGEPSRTRP